MPEIWTPTPEDCYEVQGGYVAFSYGIQLLNRPEYYAAHHYLDLKDKSAQEEILGHGQFLIWSGLRQIIRFANKPENRSPLFKSDVHYDEAMPIVRRMVDDVTQGPDFKDLYGIVAEWKPVPIEDKAVYKAVARNYHKGLTIRRAIAPIAVASYFDVSAEERDFTKITDLKRLRIFHQPREWAIRDGAL